MTVFQPAGSSFLIKKDGARPAKETITIRDLMRHTSGLIYGVFDSGPLGKMYKEAEVTSHDIDLNEFSTRMSKLPLRFEPGTAWHYGRSTDVLGRVIEIASGQTLDKFLEARIFNRHSPDSLQIHGNRTIIALPVGAIFSSNHRMV